MPEAVRNIAQYNPFVLGEELLRKTTLFQGTFVELKTELALLGIASLVVFALIWILYKSTRVHVFHKLFVHGRKKKSAAHKK